jgi:hypothetical protein
MDIFLLYSLYLLVSYFFVGYINQRIFWGGEAKKGCNQGIGFKEGNKRGGFN